MRSAERQRSEKKFCGQKCIIQSTWNLPIIPTLRTLKLALVCQRLRSSLAALHVLSCLQYSLVLRILEHHAGMPASRECVGNTVYVGKETRDWWRLDMGWSSLIAMPIRHIPHPFGAPQHFLHSAVNKGTVIASVRGDDGNGGRTELGKDPVHVCSVCGGNERTRLGLLGLNLLHWGLTQN
ncbi:hypothetical protein F4604DRAFT_1795635 [Suillus subluteus]|nr:hypothetical protein F4604DRAFT_1795635 [Suillus subluteus]